MWSDPTKADTDGDTYRDDCDPKPQSDNNDGNELEIMENVISVSEYTFELYQIYVRTGKNAEMSFDDFIDFYCDKYDTTFSKLEIVTNKYNVEVMQKCLEYLGFLNMCDDTGEKAEYGILGGKTIAAYQFFKTNYGFNISDSRIYEVSYLSLINIAINKGYESDLNPDHEALFNSYKFATHCDDVNYRYREITPILAPKISLSEKSSGVSLSLLTIKSANNYIYDYYSYDYTEPINKILKYGANEFHHHYYDCNSVKPSQTEKFVDYITYNNSEEICVRANGDELYLWMINNVKTGAKYDVKVKNRWEQMMILNDLCVPFFSSNYWFVYNNNVITPEDFGNILFGYIGNAGGFSDDELLFGGSLYSFIDSGSFDNNNDSSNVEIGYNMFEKFKGDYSYVH